MRAKAHFFAVIILIMVLQANPVFAGDLEGFKISGKTYFDYTHDISNDGPRTNGQDNSFVFRRAYLTISKQINDDFAVRFRMDADRVSAVNAQGKADDKLRPFLKHLFLKWKNLVPSSSLFIGISGTPTWSVSEKVWGYRGLSKTIWDNYKNVTDTSISSSSADVGLALKGSVLDEKISYHVMLANGSNFSHPENDTYKKFYLSLLVNPSDFIFEAYVDYEAKSSSNSNLTYKGFAGYQMGRLTLGTEYYMMVQGGQRSNGSDLNLSALSLFGRYNVNDNNTLILRYDLYDTNTDSDNTETGLIIVAFDYRPAKSISVIPNLFYYINSGDNDNADIVGNLTFVWTF